MLASGTQETLEKAEPVKGVKSAKPPIKPKPIVPTKPKQAYVSTQNAAIKSTSLSSNAGGPCSPTSEIPSAVKISQLTGPQPYGTRRTSLKRWSSSVGEESVPDNNELLSPTETPVPDLSKKVMTQHLTAHVKPVQAGSIWKGKSPFMLTTRGWGEQRWSQAKEEHELESPTQKHSYSLALQDKDLKKEETVPLNENAATNLDSSRSPSGDRETDVKLPSVPEEIKDTQRGLGSSKKAEHFEQPAQDNETVKSQSSIETLISPKDEITCESVNQLSKSEPIQDTNFEALNYESDKKTTLKTGISDSTVSEKVDRKLPIKPKDVPDEDPLQIMDNTSRQVEINYNFKSKDYREPHVISHDMTAVPKTSQVVTVNLENNHATEENPVYELSEAKVQDDRYNDHKNIEQQDLGTPVRDEEDAASGYLQQASWSPATNAEEKTDNEIHEKVEEAKEHLVSSKEHLVSSGSQLIDTSVVEQHYKTHHEDKENTHPSATTLLYTDEHYDLPVIKAANVSVAASNSSKPHYDPENNKLVDLGMQSSGNTVGSYGHYFEELEVVDVHMHEDNREETVQFNNKEQEANDKTQSGKYVSHPASTVMEEPRDHPTENRLLHENQAVYSDDNETQPAPEQPKPPDHDTVPHLYTDSKILQTDNLISGEGNARLEDEDKSHSYVERGILAKPDKPQKELSQSENYDLDTSRLSYWDSQICSTSSPQDLTGKAIPSEEVFDDETQASRFQHYKSQSPIMTEHKVNLDKLGTRESDELHYALIQSKEHKPKDIHTEEPNEIPGHVETPLHKYTHSGKPFQSELQSEDPSKEQCYVSLQAEELQPKYERSEEPGQMYNEVLGKEEACQGLEASVHEYEELEETLSGEPLSTCRLPDNSFYNAKQPVEHTHDIKPSDSSVDKYNQSSELVQTNHQLEESVSQYNNSQKLDQGYRQADEIVNRDEISDKPGHILKQSDESTDRYKTSEEPVLRYQMSEYEHPEEKDNKVVQSEETIYKHAQEFGVQPDPVHGYHPVYQQEELENTEVINGEDNSSDHTQQGQDNLMSLLQQDKVVDVGDSTPISARSYDISSDNDHNIEENLKQQLRNSYTEELIQKEITTHDELRSEITLEEQDHKDQMVEEPRPISINKQEIKDHAFPKEVHYVDGLPNNSRKEVPAERHNEFEELTPEITEDKISSHDANGNAEHVELHSVDTILDTSKENKSQEPQETHTEESPVETFDFLEGTTVLDSSYMRSRASLGKKRCHRTPATGTCAPEEEKDTEYWMFRDSTDPKSQPQKEPEEDEEEKDKSKASPDITPDNSPTPEKIVKRGGIFAGIVSPSILKGRLKSRRKSTEDEARQQGTEESKSPKKENTESSSALNWLHGLKKKKKKQPK